MYWKTTFWQKLSAIVGNNDFEWQMQVSMQPSNAKLNLYQLFTCLFPYLVSNSFQWKTQANLDTIVYVYIVPQLHLILIADLDSFHQPKLLWYNKHICTQRKENSKWKPQAKKIVMETESSKQGQTWTCYGR